MSDFKFSKIFKFNDRTILQNGFYLWVWYADKIPPHIGCSLDGLYFSLKVNGKDSALRTDKVLSLIDSKKIPTLFIKINREIHSKELFETFDHFLKAESGKTTCLSPITELLFCNSTVFQLSELLKYLNDMKQLEAVFGLNLADGYSSLHAYTKEDIEYRLRKLEHVKSEKHISPIS